MQPSPGIRTITGVATSITAFVGRAAAGPICTAASTDPPPTIASFAEYERRFGGLDLHAPMSYAVRDFFLNGGSTAVIVRVAGANAEADLADDDVIGDAEAKTGLYALERVDLFNLLCIPPRRRDVTSLPSNWSATSPAVYQAALALCVERRAMLIVDPDPAWASSIDHAIENAIDGRSDLNLAGPAARNAALYFPCVRQIDPLRDGKLDTFVPSGVIAGIMAGTDFARGVWTAPAGLGATLSGVQDLQVRLDDRETGQLTPLGINCLRSLPVTGPVVWGARTLRGAEEFADEYKYVPVRRLALYVEESLYRGTKWAVFEPNDEPLWARVRLEANAFMQGLFMQGAFAGGTADRAYFVACDKTTMTQDDIDRGIVNILVGFAAVEPAEFVVIQIRQMAGTKASGR